MVKVYREKKLSPSEVRRKARKETFERVIGVISIRTLIKYLIFTIFAVNLFRALRIRYFSQTGDAAGYVDVLSNTSDPGSLNFAYGTGVLAIHKMVVLGSDFKCPTSIPAGTDTNFFYYHAYLIGFVFRYFAALFPDPTIPTLGLLSASVSFGLFAIYNFFRTKKVALPVCAAFILLVLTSPLFYQGLSWNPYINRLFFGPSIYVVLSLMREDKIARSKLLKISIAAILCISLSERSSLYIGIAILLCLILRGRSRFKLDFSHCVLAVISVTGIIWYIVWTYLISSNRDYSSGSFSNLLANFNSAVMGARLNSFMVLITALVPFILLATASFRLFFAAIILLIPIIVVNDSTGNLDSYYAHYQSDFFPIFLAFAAVGLSNINLMKIRSAAFSAWIAVSLLASLAYINDQRPELPLKDSLQISTNEVSNSLGLYYLPNNSELARNYLQSKKMVNDTFRTIGAFISTKDSRVSAPEELMPSLISNDNRSIDYFPIGVGTSQFVLAPYLATNPEIPDVSIYGSVPLELRPLWSNCIQGVLKSKYDLVKEWQTGSGRISLYKLIDP